MFTTVVVVMLAIATGQSKEVIMTDSDADPNVTFISCGLIGTREAQAWFVREGYAARGYQFGRVKCIAGKYTKKVDA